MMSLVIQAGGESRRMGRNKALIPVLGEPLIQRVYQRLSSLAEEILITTNQPEDLAFLGLKTYQDIIPGKGALGGLYTAIVAATQPFVAVVACDMPFANPELIHFLENILIEDAQWDLAIPRTVEGFEPFHAVYRKETCLPVIRTALEMGKLRMISWFDDVHPFILETAAIQKIDPALQAFFNVNTPQDLETAEKLIQAYS